MPDTAAAETEPEAPGAKDAEIEALLDRMYELKQQLVAEEAKNARLEATVSNEQRALIASHLTVPLACRAASRGSVR